MTEELLRIDSLSVRLPAGAERSHAVEDVSLTLRRNEILCVVGESGSGKSVMARSVMRLLPRRLAVDNGAIQFDGEDLLGASEARMRKLRGRAISMIFQEPMSALNPLFTIGQQIEEVVIIHRASNKAERRDQILDILDAVHLPDPDKIIDAYPHEISGGQRQRAMIAMALILGPRVLIADEPTPALDVTTQAQILHLIKELQHGHGTGVIFITHDFGVVAEIADRIAVMKDGRLVEAGTATQVLNTPRREYTRELIAAVPSLISNRPAVPEERRTVLELRNLEKIYSGGRRGLFGGTKRQVHAVQDVSFALRQGETLGIVGESGSGKSTVARCIARLVPSDGGEILFGDVDLLALNRKQMLPFRRRIQMIFQDPYGSLNPRLRVGHMVAQGPIIHGVSQKEALRRAAELLDLVGLDARAADRYAHEFSGGQRQRIGIARALALEPEILIADEAVSALDVSIQAQVLRLLAEIRERFHLTMLFITHDLRVAAQVCDSIAVMHQGSVVEYGAARQLFTAPKHTYTRSLLEAVPGRDWDHKRVA